MIYLDNSATTSPKPPSVIRAVTDGLRLYSANPGRGGHAPSVRAAEAVYSARKNIAAFFGMEREENVIFTQNCTAAINTVIKGVLKEGDHVIISSFEHNAVVRPLESLKNRGIITYSVADVSADDDKTLENFRREINSRTRMIICAHASNVFGTVPPVGRLCALAHSYGLVFCLDAAQSAGVLPINLDEDGFDYICCAGHKGLYGPMGTGLLLIGRGGPIAPLIEGGTGSNSDSALMPEHLPDRFESGTLNLPGILGLSAGVSFVADKGVGSIYRHESTLIRYLYNGLNETDKIRLYTQIEEGIRLAPVLSFNIEGHDSEQVAAFLDKRFSTALRAGLHCAPLAHRYMGTLDTGTVRVSPSVFTTRAQIDVLLNGIRNFVNSH